MSTDEFTNGQYSFHGYASSKIYYENEDKLWHLELLSNSSIYATTKASNGDYPFGTRRWQVFSGQVQGNFTFNFNGCDDHIQGQPRRIGPDLFGSQVVIETLDNPSFAFGLSN